MRKIFFLLLMSITTINIFAFQLSDAEQFEVWLNAPTIIGNNGQPWKVIEINGDYRLQQYIESSNEGHPACPKNNVVLKFKFYDTDIIMNGCCKFPVGYLDIPYVYTFDGFTNCLIIQSEPDYNIIFEPTAEKEISNFDWDRYYNAAIKFKNCEHITVQGLHIICKGYLCPKVDDSPAADYEASFIRLEAPNRDIIFKDNYIKGTDDNITGIAEDFRHFPISGAFLVINTEPGLNNRYIDFINNTILQFQLFGIKMVGATVDYFALIPDGRNDIQNNIIRYIWENEDHYSAQAGGILLIESQGVNIESNKIESVYSFFYNLNNKTIDQMKLNQSLHEQLQHGIYVSHSNRDIYIENNTIAEISGGAIIVKRQNLEQEMNVNVFIKLNTIKYCMNEAITILNGDNIEVENNTIHYCGYRLSAHPDAFANKVAILNNITDEDGLYLFRKRRGDVIGLIEFKETCGGIWWLTFRNNRINHNIYQIYSKDNFYDDKYMEVNDLNQTDLNNIELSVYSNQNGQPDYCASLNTPDNQYLHTRIKLVYVAADFVINILPGTLYWCLANYFCTYGNTIYIRTKVGGTYLVDWMRNQSGTLQHLKILDEWDPADYRYIKSNRNLFSITTGINILGERHYAVSYYDIKSDPVLHNLVSMYFAEEVY